ncbi:MAG: hypothetical protein M3Q10_18805, partial [Chloroflexota bacterium]|nr:hypothetical protein [Chloroflexota bacterium]
ADRSAESLAGDARERFGTRLGLALVAAVGDEDERGVRDATVTVAVTGEADARATFPLRAAYAEVQRRAALHAADVIRRALLPG